MVGECWECVGEWEILHLSVLYIIFHFNLYYNCYERN